MSIRQFTTFDGCFDTSGTEIDMRGFVRLSVAATALTGILTNASAHAQHAVCTASADAGEVEGVVVDRIMRVPLRGAEVSVRWLSPSGDWNRRAAETDEHGRFRVCGIPLRERLFVRAAYIGEQTDTRLITLDGGVPGRFELSINAPSSPLEGRVIDHASSIPIASASVRLDGMPAAQLTNAEGRFRFERVPTGRHALSVEHIGFLPFADTVDVGYSGRVHATVRLAPSAITVAALEVTVQSFRLERVGFYQRQERRIGKYLTRSTIDALRASRGSDLLRGLAGVHFRRGRFGTVVEGRGNCPFRFIMDGARIGPGFTIDDVPPQTIEGIEVYMGASEVPAEFIGLASDPNGTCGVIVIWTRSRA